MPEGTYRSNRKRGRYPNKPKHDYHTPEILGVVCPHCAALPGERCLDTGLSPHRLRRLASDEVEFRAMVVERDMG